MFPLPSPPSLIVCGMQIEPGKSNDTSGTHAEEEDSKHTWEVVPEEESQGPFF